VSAPKYCPECGAKIDSSWKHCPSCGKSFYSAQSVSPEPDSWPSGFPGIRTEEEIDSGALEIIEEITSEIELRNFFIDESGFQNWNRLGRPKLIKVNGYAMSEFYYLFLKRFGYEYPTEIMDLWIEVGKPDVKSWDLEGDFKRYQERQLKSAKRTKRLNLLGAVVGGLASGAGSAVSAVSKNSSNSSNSSRVSITSGVCGRCGSTTAGIGSVCRYCQV
jgi:hypothetical protein